MENIAKSWIVWKGRDFPGRIYLTEAEARKEAEIEAKNRGGEVYLLEVKEVCLQEFQLPPPVRWEKLLPSPYVGGG